MLQFFEMPVFEGEDLVVLQNLKYYQSLCQYAHYFIFIAKRLHRAGEPSFTDDACSCYY
jgi:hypothetical protein